MFIGFHSPEINNVGKRSAVCHWPLGKRKENAGCTAGASLNICSPKFTRGTQCGMAASEGECGPAARMLGSCACELIPGLLGSGKLRCIFQVPAHPLLLLSPAYPHCWQSLPCAAQGHDYLRFSLPCFATLHHMVLIYIQYHSLVFLVLLKSMKLMECK